MAPFGDVPLLTTHRMAPGRRGVSAESTMLAGLDGGQRMGGLGAAGGSMSGLPLVLGDASA